MVACLSTLCIVWLLDGWRHIVQTVPSISVIGTENRRIWISRGKCLKAFQLTCSTGCTLSHNRFDWLQIKYEKSMAVSFLKQQQCAHTQCVQIKKNCTDTNIPLSIGAPFKFNQFERVYILIKPNRSQRNIVSMYEIASIFDSIHMPLMNPMRINGEKPCLHFLLCTSNTSNEMLNRKFLCGATTATAAVRLTVVAAAVAAQCVWICVPYKVSATLFYSLCTREINTHNDGYV